MKMSEKKKVLKENSKMNKTKYRILFFNGKMMGDCLFEKTYKNSKALIKAFTRIPKEDEEDYIGSRNTTDICYYFYGLSLERIATICRGKLKKIITFMEENILFDEDIEQLTDFFNKYIDLYNKGNWKEVRELITNNNFSFYHKSFTDVYDNWPIIDLTKLKKFVKAETEEEKINFIIKYINEHIDDMIDFNGYSEFKKIID
jgi:hypothetical protein